MEAGKRASFLISRPRLSLAKRTQWEEEPEVVPRVFLSEDRIHFRYFGFISESGSTVTRRFLLFLVLFGMMISIDSACFHV